MESLLERLKPGHPVAALSDDADELATFIVDLHHHEEGHSSRYGHRRDGTDCLADVCWIEREDLMRLADLAHA